MTSSYTKPNRESPSRSWSLLRVLCLHDARSNSMELSAKLDALGEKLYRNHGIDLVFVDAPLIVNKNETQDCKCDDTGETPIQLKNIQSHPPRAWWEEETESETRDTGIAEEKVENKKEDDDDVDESKSNDEREANNIASSNPNKSYTTSPGSQPPRYVGLDASLLLLRQVWNSSPFWGILAFGQAAGVAAFLPLLPGQNGKVGQPPSFMIFVNGMTLLDEEEPLTEHLALPCLHIVDTTGIKGDDAPKPATARSNPTQRLVRQFGGSVFCDESLSASTSASTSHSDSKPFSKAFNNKVGRFLVDRKRHLRNDVGDVTILALRHELHRTEADAAQLVAQQIARNPPDALMAVITPKDVGGFRDRDRRRGPDEEGGGAPCPSEFLLHRAKRSEGASQAKKDPSSETGGSFETTPAQESPGKDASRHHPNQQPNPSQEQRKEPL